MVELRLNKKVTQLVLEKIANAIGWPKYIINQIGNLIGLTNFKPNIKLDWIYFSLWYSNKNIMPFVFFIHLYLFFL